MFTLNEKHRAELRSSGISDDMMDRAGIYSAGGDRIRAILGWGSKDFAWGDGWVIPYPCTEEEEATYARVKLDFPRHDAAGKMVKYESPRGTSNRAYFPPRFREVLEQSGVLLVTEGEKKALAAADRGFACIGLVGVWGWQRKRKRRTTGKATGPRLLIDNLNETNLWKGRKVFIVFDSDAAQKQSVQDAERALAEVLSGLAQVNIVRLPSGADSLKVGLDDFLVGHGENGAAELRKLLDHSAPVAVSGQQSGQSPLMCLADEYIAQHLMHTDGFILRSYRDEFWLWTGRHYRRLLNSDLEKEVLTWLDRRSDKATPKLARDVVACIAARTFVPAHHEQPVWTDSTIATRPGDWIVMGNGILDLRALLSGQQDVLKPHTPRFFTPISLPYDFDPEAECPRWLAFLEEVMEHDAERIALLQEWCGYNLVPDTVFHKFLLVIGEGANGKSVFLQILEALVGGENVSHVGLEMFGGRFQLSPTIGKLANIIPEVGELAKPDEAVFKAYVAGNAVQMDRKNKEPISVRPTAKVTIATNVPPRWTDRSEGIWRRILPVHFRVVIPEAKQDRNLASFIVENELPGVFCWAVAGLMRLYQQQKFTTPSLVAEAVKEYREEVNPAREFLVEETVAQSDAVVHSMLVYRMYAEWCQARGYRPLAANNFGKEVRRAHPGVERCQIRQGEARVWVFKGLAVAGADGDGGGPPTNTRLV